MLLWQGTELWDAQDTVTTIVVGLGVMLTWLRPRQLGLAVTDPLVNTGFAVCFIGLTQLTLAYKIFTVGGEGLAGAMLLADPSGIMARLGQLSLENVGQPPPAVHS